MVRGLYRNIFPAMIGAGFLYLAFQPEIRHVLPELVLIAAVQIVLLAWLYWLGEKGEAIFTLWEIMVWALLFRAFFLFSDPSLSDDIYRYAWDGLQTKSLENPYLYPPERYISSGLPDELTKLLSRVNHPSIGSVYPPVAQFFFAVSQNIFQGEVGIRILLIVIDILSCILLFRLAPIPQAAILYAWTPLAVIECASSGHIDVLMIFFVLMALLFLKKERVSLSGIFMAFAFLTKITPIFFIPFFMDYLRRKKSLLKAIEFMIAFLLASIICIIPFWTAISNLLANLMIYASTWEFSGLLFNALKPILGNQAARLTLFICFVLIYVIIFFKEKDLYKRLLLVATSFILTSATVHPWYLLLPVALVCFNPSPFGIVLAWCAFLPYYTQIGYSVSGIWLEEPLMTLMLFLSLLAMFIHYIIGNSKEGLN